MSSGYTDDSNTEVSDGTGEITWDSREENLKNETEIRASRMKTAYKLLWQSIDSLMSNLRIIKQPPCQRDIQIIRRDLTRAQQKLELIEQQHNQLRKIRAAGNQIQAIKDQVSGKI